jgi:hypothetical protein
VSRAVGERASSKKEARTELTSSLHPPLDGPIVIRTHVLEAHEVTVEALEDSVQIGATWTLPDGRVWMSAVRSAEA